MGSVRHIVGCAVAAIFCSAHNQTGGRAKLKRPTLRRLVEKFGRIPQDEIDREAKALIEEHGVLAEDIARGQRERGDWVKGNSDIPERTARVHEAVLRLNAERQTPR